MDDIALAKHRDPQQFQRIGCTAGGKELHRTGNLLKQNGWKGNHQDKKRERKSNRFQVIPSQKEEDYSPDYDQKREALGEVFCRQPSEKQQNQPEYKKEQSPVGGTARVRQIFSLLPDEIEAHQGDQKTMRKIRKIDPVLNERY